MSTCLTFLFYIGDDMAKTGKLLMVVGKSTCGKSYSLKGLKNPDKVAYLNAESGKNLPFRNTFKRYIITEPKTELLGAGCWLEQIAQHPDKIETVVIDSLTFLMDMYEVKYVKTAQNTQQAWGTYADFFINIMNQQVPKLIKAGINVIIIAHTADTFNEKEMSIDVAVPLKGAIGKKGAEAFFNDIVACKKIKLENLKDYSSDLLHITERDEELGYKHVIQTRLTKETVNERLRSPEDMWSKNETYIDGNVQLVLDRMNEFYGE